MRCGGKRVGILKSYVYLMSCYVMFFFSSRRRHTRLQGDWSSDVCSSDLPWVFWRLLVPAWRPSDKDTNFSGLRWLRGMGTDPRLLLESVWFLAINAGTMRSEERRVGKECRSRWSPYH